MFSDPVINQLGACMKASNFPFTIIVYNIPMLKYYITPRTLCGYEIKHRFIFGIWI